MLNTISNDSDTKHIDKSELRKCSELFNEILSLCILITYKLYNIHTHIYQITVIQVNYLNKLNLQKDFIKI